MGKIIFPEEFKSRITPDDISDLVELRLVDKIGFVSIKRHEEIDNGGDTTGVLYFAFQTEIETYRFGYKEIDKESDSGFLAHLSWTLTENGLYVAKSEFDQGSAIGRYKLDGILYQEKD